MRRIALCLCLGAATTVLLAWALALSPGRRQWSMTGMSIDPPRSAAVPRQFNIEHEMSASDEWVQVIVVKMQNGVLSDGTPCLELAGAYASLGPTLTTEPPWRFDPATAGLVRGAVASFPYFAWPSWLPALPSSGPGLVSYGGRATGWPLKSMRSVSRLERAGGELRWSGSLRIVPRSRYKPPYARGPHLGSIPLYPVPLGFAADTAIFSALWAAPLLLPRAVRTLRRRRRGQCERCGYPLGPSGGPCPECGAPNTPGPAPAAAK